MIVAAPILTAVEVASIVGSIYALLKLISNGILSTLRIDHS